jgi:hypothetical protein
MTNLIARLEVATEGNRELDAEIWLHCTQRGAEFVQLYGYKPSLVLSSDRMAGGLPHFTTSLDAARTLVPEGKEWSLSHFQKPRRYYEACIGNPVASNFEIVVEAPTAELALCIASLKARQAGER